MQRTEKYFEQDAFRTQCESTILAAEPDEKTGGGRIALDGTVFYPEGGGQPADRGTLTLPDGTTLNVTAVHEHDGILWHSVDALPESAVPGTAVSGCIDWEWRFDKMQQHTGEHILSGILHQMFGAENVGFHIGSEAVRMDTSVPISAEGLQAAELAANRIVWQDVPVLVSYPTREELAALVYRSKKEIEGQVRIVTIPGADVCACCGTHTRTTGQVGQIKILASENYKGGVRLSVVCGQRALLAAQAMRQRQAEIGALLSAKADQTAVAVHRVYDEYTALKFTHFGVCSQLFDALAQLANPGEDAIRTVPGLDPDGLHRLAVRLTEATTGLCAALTPTEKGTGYCLAQAGGDVRVIQCPGDVRLGGVVALALGEQVIVQVCVENDLFCHGIPLLSDYCQQRTGFGVRMRGQIREKRGQISEKCSLLRLPPVLGGGDSQYFLEDTREGAGAGEARADSDLFHAPAVARHQQLGTGVVHPVAVDVFLERDVQLVLDGGGEILLVGTEGTYQVLPAEIRVEEG